MPDEILHTMQEELLEEEVEEAVICGIGDHCG